MMKIKKQSDGPLVAEVPINIKELENNPKKFTIYYSIGNENEFFIAEGDDYKLSTLDIQSTHTGEVFAFPVIFVIDNDLDTLEIIPMNKIDNIKYNWGFKEEAQHFQTQIETLKKEMQKNNKRGKSKRDVVSAAIEDNHAYV